MCAVCAGNLRRSVGRGVHHDDLGGPSQLAGYSATPPGCAPFKVRGK